MAEFGVHEAKTHFSSLLRRAAAGEEILITRRGKRVARLVRIQQPRHRQLGIDRGRLTIPEDFDEPLPEDIQRAFET